VRLAPVVEQIAQDYAGKLKVVGLNAHENYDTAAGYGIMGIPTLLLFKGGQEVGRLVGAQPKDRIVGEIKAKLGV
jgi:thioredoxin 1